MTSRPDDFRRSPSAKQRGQGGGARMQDHAAEMRVVEVEHVAHLAVRDRRIQQAELASALPQHGGHRHGAELLEVVSSMVTVGCVLPASAHPIQSSTARFASCTAAGDRSS